MFHEINSKYLKAKNEYENSNFQHSLNLISEIETLIEIRNLSTEVHELYGEVLLLCGLNNYYLNNFDISIEKTLFAISLLESTTNILLLSKAYSLLGSSYYSKSDFPKSLEYSKKTLELRNELNDKHGISQSLYLIGNIHNVTGSYTDAIESYSKSLKIKEEIYDFQGIVSNYIALGTVYKERSEYSITLDYYNKALELSRIHSFTLSTANTLTNIGLVHHNLGDFTKALEYYQESLPLFIELRNTYGMTNCYNNIGLVYAVIEEFKTSLEFHFKSLEINESIQNKHGIAISLNNIGKIYETLQEFDKSIEHYNKSLSLRLQIQNKKGIASSLKNIAIIHLLMGKFDEAFQKFQESFSLNKELDDKVGIITTLVSLGTLYSNKEFSNYSSSKAEELLKDAESKALEISYKVGLINVYIALSNMYEQIADFDVALEYYKKSVTIEKEYFAELSIQTTRKFEYRLSIEEAQRERIILSSKLEEQERLLHDILPSSIAKRILKGEKTISEHIENACILFADIVGFTEISQTISSDEMVMNLNQIFQNFDSLAKKHNIEKIKTIGDSYVAMSTQTNDNKYPSVAIAMFALELVESSKLLKFGSKPLEVRIGIHIGDIVSGVIGGHKYSYDIWGDVVNVASRMESYSKPGKIHISEEFGNSIESHPEFEIIPRGEISIKGKGTMNTYWLEKIQKK